MNSNDLAKEQSRHVRRRHCFCRRDEDSHFGKSVHDDENGVMVVAWRKICDPVQGDAGPRPGRDWERGQETERSMPNNLVPGTCIAALDIGLHRCS